MILGGLLLSASVNACRYNVRDIGFVDLEPDGYTIFAFVPPGMDPATRSALEKVTLTALSRSNVRCEFVDAQASPDHPALVHRRPSSTTPSLSAVLLSPDGQALDLDLNPSSAPHAASSISSALPAWSSQLEGLVASPLRQTLLRDVSQAFGAILLIEGTDATANQAATQNILAGIEQTRALMRGLPKAISTPPTLVSLPPSLAYSERILLWSLRQSTAPQAAPRAAVIYGRARWIGPLMQGEEISARNLAGLFSIIGADCECGMDLLWTQGTRLPIRWAESLEEVVAKNLGFDPENPVVKSEVSGILGRRGSSPGSRSQDYGKSSDQTLSSVPASASTSTTGSKTSLGPPREPKPVDEAPRTGLGWKLLGASALTVLAVGLGLFWRATQRNASS